MNDSLYWHACAESHVRFAQMVRDYLWTQLSDCVVLERHQILEAFGVQCIRESRMTRFQDDIRPWFPYLVWTRMVGKGRKIHSCYLSRFPFPDGAMTGAMLTRDRQIRLGEAGLRTISLSQSL